jgi:hypothetical protein
LDLSCVMFTHDLAYVGTITIPDGYRFFDVLNRPVLSAQLGTIDRNDIIQMRDANIILGDEIRNATQLQINRRSILLAYDEQPRMGDDQERAIALKTHRPESAEVVLSNGFLIRGTTKGFFFKQDAKLFIAINGASVSRLDGSPVPLLDRELPFLAVNTYQIASYCVGVDLPV